MNLNAIRTVLAGIASALMAVMGFLPQALGCVDNMSGGFDCTNSWLPPAWAATIAAILGGAALLLKMFQGGGFGAALFKPVAVVDNSGKAGTVTQTQVDSGSK